MTLLLLLPLLAAAAASSATAAAAATCAATGQGFPCLEDRPGFVWQPPSSAPTPDPVLAGTAAHLWLRTAAPGSGLPGRCGWYSAIEDCKVLLPHCMHTRALCMPHH